MITLESIDGYGPLFVMRVASDGSVTEIGAGSDPRMLDEDTFGYAEVDYDAGTSFFVRIATDGTIDTQRRGNGRAGGLGGLAPRRLSPYARDGRLMAFAASGCESARVRRHTRPHDPVTYGVWADAASLLVGDREIGIASRSRVTSTSSLASPVRACRARSRDSMPPAGDQAVGS